MQLNYRRSVLLFLLLVSSSVAVALIALAISALAVRSPYGNPLLPSGDIPNVPSSNEIVERQAEEGEAEEGGAIQGEMRVLPGGKSACRTKSPGYGRFTDYLIEMLEVRTSKELYDVAVWQRLGSQPVVFGSVDRNWNPLKYIGDVTDASEIEIVWDRSLPLQIAASSQRGGVRDLVFGLGDPQNPQLTFRTSIGGLVQGSIFYFDTPGGAPTVVGSFTACVTELAV